MHDAAVTLSPTGTYSLTVENIRSLLVKSNDNKSVKIQWIKAYAGINGNELADRGAKDVHKNSRSQTLQCFLFVYRKFLVIFSCSIKSIGWNTGSRIQSTDFTGAGQFLRSVRLDESTMDYGVAWKTPSCIYSCQLCIKSEVCCGTV